MAATPGKNAALTFGATVTLLLNNVTVEHNNELIDITAFSDVGVQKMLSGITGWTASGSGPWDIGNTADVGESQTLTYTPIAGSTWSGTALLQSISLSSTVADANLATYNFVGNGALTPPS